MGRRTGAAREKSEVDEIEGVLRSQWAQLREWLDALPPASRTRPSVLPGWTVAELVAHLGRTMDALAACEPSEPGTEPQSLGRYIGKYAEGAAHIDVVTRELAEETKADPLGALDRYAAAADARLRQLRRDHHDPVVLARRGPIRLSDFLVSRVVELVVHGDDLARSLADGALLPPGRVVGREGPVQERALALVADALLTVVVGRGGWDLEVVAPLPWVRLAAGRQPYDTDHLAAAVQARHTSDSVPDLGTMLPLL